VAGSGIHRRHVVLRAGVDLACGLHAEVEHLPLDGELVAVLLQAAAAILASVSRTSSGNGVLWALCSYLKHLSHSPKCLGGTSPSSTTDFESSAPGIGRTAWTSKPTVGKRRLLAPADELERLEPLCRQATR